MDTKIITNTQGRIAIIHSNEVIINDSQTALGFIVNTGYENDCRKIAINKEAITEDFFKLSTGLAGDIAQKFVNYNFMFAIIGDFSCYTSKSARQLYL
jgi:GTP-sensing pleiotropic transcriptional regulator CodY